MTKRSILDVAVVLDPPLETFTDLDFISYKKLAIKQKRENTTVKR